jgi:divalent metal cation (Fe/Co/Zn/Cd) transporter
MPDVNISRRDGRRVGLLRAGYLLEATTLAWNVVGVCVLAVAAVGARSVALGGFGLDSLIEIGASTVVIWELNEGVCQVRRRRAMRLIGGAFIVLATYLAVQSTVVLAIGYRPKHSQLGIWWTAFTAVVMFGLALGKARVGGALNNPVLQTEGRITFVDGLLATAVLLGLSLNAVAGWWWADPSAGYVLLLYAVWEGTAALRLHDSPSVVMAETDDRPGPLDDPKGHAPERKP